MSSTTSTPARRASSGSGPDFELPRSPVRSRSSMDWPDLDLTEVPLPYLLDRMDRDRESTAAFIDFLRRQAKNEERYCTGLEKCFEDPKSRPGGNLLGSLQSFGRDLLGEPNEKHVLNESESTAGYLHTINDALLSYARERRRFAKFLDAKLCSTLEKHVAARARVYDTLKRERASAARGHSEARRRVESARSHSQRAKKEWHREEAELSTLSQRGEDPMSEGYERQLKRYKESCQRADRAAETQEQEEGAAKNATRKLKAV